MSDDAMRFWRDNAYLPWNNAAGCLTHALSYDRVRLSIEAARIIVGIQDRAKIEPVTEAQRIFLAWFEDALFDIIEQVIKAAANGSAPPLTFDGEDGVERMLRFVCSLKVKPFLGVEAPELMCRWSSSPGGRVIDIVPSDPRWGGDDIPDWSEP